MKHPQNSGFTLIEVMIVVVIIGILSAIAYPSYQNYSKQTRRADAKAYLLEIATQQEKLFSDCSWYAATLDNTVSRTCGADKDGGILAISGQTLDGNYTVTPTEGNIAGAACSTAGGTANWNCGFTLTAAPNAGGQQVGNGNLRIDATGRREWDKNGGGTWYGWDAK